jgi:hypothetical protein
VTCSEELTPFDAVMAKNLRDLATREIEAEARARGVSDAIDQGDLQQARVELEQIASGSVYRRSAEDRLDAAVATILPTLAAQASRAKDKDCKRYDDLLQRIEDKYGKAVERLVKAKVTCAGRATVKPPAVCDAEALKDTAQQAFTSGAFGQALKGFEDSYACRASADTAMRAFITACNLKRATAARKWFQALPGNMQTQTKVICTRNGISEEDLRPCDAEAIKDKAQAAFASTDFAQALKGFEDSYACRQDANTAMRAFITACNLKKTASAKKWFLVMPGNMQTQVKVICIRNGISEDQLK